MNQQDAPDNEPKLVIAQSNLRPIGVPGNEEFDAVNFWTMDTLGEHLAEVPDHLVPGYFSWNVSLIQGAAGAGEAGTSSSAIRNGLGGGKDIIDAALSELKAQYYCDGKRGPGKHIWDLKFKPESASNSSDAAESASNDYDEDLVAA